MKRVFGALLLGGACTLVSACEEPVVTSSSTTATRAPSAAAASSAPVEQGPPRVEFQESEFAETDRSRDPFRSYEDLIVAEVRGNLRSQRNVVLDEFSIDELRLIGIVTGIEPAKAMLVDPKGKGHVVERGQFIGRSELVQGTGVGAPNFEINWRIDRIREGDIVLVREDPNNPDVPSATRVIALRPEGDATLQ
ncbi:MAG: pilus assembly protein PilP [Polyangiaceae bacterium]|nr:pilus assembly protein PilP [Polyangiaceae bacterium]